jgi:hypothetical protein
MRGVDGEPRDLERGAVRLRAHEADDRAAVIGARDPHRGRRVVAEDRRQAAVRERRRIERVRLRERDEVGAERLDDGGGR